MTIFLEIVKAYILEQLGVYKKKSENNDQSALVSVANFSARLFGAKPMRDTDVSNQKRNYVQEFMNVLSQYDGQGAGSDENIEKYIAEILETLRTTTHARAMEKDIQGEGKLGVVIATSKTTIVKIFEVMKEFSLLDIEIERERTPTPLYILQKQIATYLAKKETQTLDQMGMGLYKERKQLLKVCLQECRDLETMHANAMHNSKDKDLGDAAKWEETHRKAIADKIELLIKHNQELTAKRKMVDPTVPVPGLSLLSLNLDVRKMGPGEGSLKRLLRAALDQIAPGGMASTRSNDDRNMLLQFREKINPQAMSSSPN